MSKRRGLRSRHRNRGKLKAARREERRRQMILSVSQSMAEYIKSRLGGQSIGRTLFVINPETIDPNAAVMLGFKTRLPIP